MNSSLQLEQPGFVLANARWLAQASAAAYLPAGGEAPRLMAKTGAATPHRISSPVTDTHAIITAYDDCTVIAFRGTAGLRNWITDAEFPLRPLTGIPSPRAAAAGPNVVSALGPSRAPLRVHGGFLAALDSVLPDIIEYLASASPLPPASFPPIIFTGHSLGGALAVLCAYILQRQGWPIHRVCTFGQPRVGDKNFAADYEAVLGPRTFRVVNQNDLVPRLPGWLLGYRHAGQLAFINVAGRLLLNPALLSLLTSDALGLWQAYRRLDDVLINEHFMGHYLTALNAPGLECGDPPPLFPNVTCRVAPAAESLAPAEMPVKPR